MRRSIGKFTSALIVSLILLGLLSSAAFAQALPPAKDAPWVVSVTYQNVGTGPATILVEF